MYNIIHVYMLRTVDTHSDTIGKSKVEVGSINLLELNAIDGNANLYESRALPMLGSPRQLGYVSTLPIVFHKAWSNKLGDHCVPGQALQAPCTRGKQDTYVGSWYVRLHLVAACIVPKVCRKTFLVPRSKVSKVGFDCQLQCASSQQVVEVVNFRSTGWDPPLNTIPCLRQWFWSKRWYFR